MNPQKICTYREGINKIDTKLLSLLKKRFKICKRIGEYKKQNNLPIEDLKREKQIIKSKIKSSNLSEKFTKELFKIIFKESKSIQSK